MPAAAEADTSILGSASSALGAVAAGASEMVSPTVAQAPDSPGTTSFFDDAATAASAAATAAGSAVTSAVDDASKTADAAATSAYRSLGASQKDMVDSVVKTATSTADMAAKLGQDKLAELEQWKEEIRTEVTIMVEAKILEKLHEVFGTVGDQIKEGLFDEDMPEATAPSATTLVDVRHANPNPNARHFGRSSRMGRTGPWIESWMRCGFPHRSRGPWRWR